MSVVLIVIVSAGSNKTSSSRECTADTERQLLALFQQIGPPSATVTEADYIRKGFYNLALTWQPSWGVETWQKLGCLANATSLIVNGSGLTYSLPDSFGSSGAFPQLLSLEIANASVSGTLPDSWARQGAFLKLKRLTLYNNSHSGKLPDSWARHGAFPQLQNLSLANNKFAEELPATWAGSASFKELCFLGLSGNSLSGSLPEAWGMHGGFQQLKVLQLNGNKFTGALPASWGAAGTFPQLQVMLLDGNRLTGTLPGHWGANGSLPDVQILSLGYNDFTGTLPEEWGADGGFPALQELDLESSSIRGSLPSEWGLQGRFPQLQTLNLVHNSLTRTLPDAWGTNGSFPQLQTLSLGVNKIEGTLPLCWGANGGFPNLTWLSLVFNRLAGELPADWGKVGRFPALNGLFLSYNSVAGSLPLSWAAPGAFSRLTSLHLDTNSLTGMLPQEWGSRVNGSFPDLLVLNLGGNRLAGMLPSTWGDVGTFPSLLVLDLSHNTLGGPLPLSWVSSGAFPELWTLSLSNNSLMGDLPATWGADAGANLNILDLTCNMFNGSIPAVWGEMSHFKQLVSLNVSYNALTGELPRFDNRNLSVLDFQHNSVTVSGSLGDFWKSSTPLFALDLSHTHLSGSLPNKLVFGGTLLILHVDSTFLQGRIPFSWLLPDGELSKITLIGDELWLRTTASAAWKRQVCMNKVIYQYNQDASLKILSNAVNAKLKLHALGVFKLDYNSFFGASNTDRTLQAICSNKKAPMVIGAIWGSFLALVMLIVSVYAWVKDKESGHLKPPWLPKCPDVLFSIESCASALFGLVLYCGTFVNDIRVMYEVWGLWSCYALLAAFLWHHIYRGLVVSFYCARLYYGSFYLAETGQILSPQAGASQWARRVLALVMSPLAFLLTYVMDVWSFFEAFGAPSPRMLELESYADMRAVVMPICQSLFSAIITSVIFRLGNNPNNGIFYSVLLYTRSVVFSCAAILMGLGRLLYICHNRDRRILRTTLLLMTGKLLHPVHDGRRAAFQPSSDGGFWRWLVCGLACPRWECRNLLKRLDRADDIATEMIIRPKARMSMRRSATL